MSLPALTEKDEAELRWAIRTGADIIAMSYVRIATDIEDYALHVHEVMDGLEGFHNDGMLTVSLPVEHVGKGNADEAAGLRHADFTESERFSGRILTNFEKKGLAAGRVIHDLTYRCV